MASCQKKPAFRKVRIRRFFLSISLIALVTLPIQDTPWHLRVSVKTEQAEKKAVSLSARLQELDVIVRATDGLWSPLFAAMSVGDQRYSHTGLLLKDDQGQMFVLHADADDTTGLGQVKITPWNEFRRESLRWSVYRAKALSEAQKLRLHSIAWQQLGIPFDLEFDLNTQDKLYCTELIAHIFAVGAGFEWPAARTVWNGKKVLSVGDLLEADWLKAVETTD
jgi:hypothetical protein